MSCIYWGGDGICMTSMGWKKLVGLEWRGVVMLVLITFYFLQEEEWWGRNWILEVCWDKWNRASSGKGFTGSSSTGNLIVSVGCSGSTCGLKALHCSSKTEPWDPSVTSGHSRRATGKAKSMLINTKYVWTHVCSLLTWTIKVLSRTLI